MTREGLIEAIMESLLDPDEWSLKPGKSRDINFEARLRKQYPKDSYTELWNRRRTISRERWLRGDVLHRPNQHDPTATKAQRRFGKMTSGPPRRRELEISAPDQPPLRVPMGRKNQNKEAGGKFKALMTDRIADISAKEQGVKVRGKRRQTIRGLAYEAPRRGTASWKQHKQGRQYEELIEDILESSRKPYKVGVYCIRHGHKEFNIPSITPGASKSLNTTCYYCKDAVERKIKDIQMHNTFNRPGVCGICGGPTPCLRDD